MAKKLKGEEFYLSANDLICGDVIYLTKNKWIPAIKRFKTVVNEYGSTVYVEEPLHRLVEIHYKIGLEKEAKQSRSTQSINPQALKSEQRFTENIGIVRQLYT